MALIKKIKHLFIRLIYKISKAKTVCIIDGYCNSEKNDFSKRNIIINRVKFFFESNKIIKFKYHNKFKLLYLLLPGKKFFFGIESIPKYFRRDYCFFNIDPYKSHYDGWEYHEVLSLNEPFTENLINNSFGKFNCFYRNLTKKQLSKTCLFATGPSLEKAINKNWDDFYKIVCNTIVKDKILWNHLQPDIIVAGDALYHFGDNLFAAEFRKDLSKRLEETRNTVFIYPSLFHPFVSKHFNKFEDRLIPIPIGNHNNICNILTENFCLPGLGNVLNLLLLPLGATFSKKIYFWGFDGRAPDDKDFWKNSDIHFYSDLVSDIKAKHPKFFDYYIPKGNEKKYVEDVHGDSLDIALTEAEKNGWEFKMLHFSYTAALQKRIINI
jgi:hypothetical protein